MLGCFGCLKSAIMICNDPDVLEVDGGRRSLEIQIGQDNKKIEAMQRLSKAWRSCSIASVTLRMASRGLSWRTRRTSPSRMGQRYVVVHAFYAMHSMPCLIYVTLHSTQTGSSSPA